MTNTPRRIQNSYDPPSRGMGAHITIEYPKGKGSNPVFRSTNNMFDVGNGRYETHIDIPDNREVADATAVRKRRK